MDQMRIFDEFVFIPPLLPSHASKADVQRDEGTGGKSVLTPVSLPFSLPWLFEERYGTQKGRVTGGIFHATPVHQTPYT